MNTRIILVGLISVVFFAGQVMGATTGKISGRVLDAETGEPLIGANIIIEDTDMGASTDEEGYYHIINVPVGTYSVRALYIGYQTVRKTEVRVNVGLTRTLNFELSPSALQADEVVTVTAERPIVRKDVTSGRSIVSSDEIEKMPVETVSGILSTKAGVTEGADGAIHIRGGRSEEVSYVIDGVRVSSPSIGGMGVNVENQAIQELEVVSGTFNAEYGQAMSGVVNIVTKQGGKNYHGSFSSYLGDYVTEHSDIFWNDPQFNPVNSRNLEFTLSGPILPFDGMRDKLTFFVSHRNYKNSGYIFGRRHHKPSDAVYLESSDLYQANYNRNQLRARGITAENFADHLNEVLSSSSLLLTDYGDQMNIGETFKDKNGNGRFDGGEPYFDLNGNTEFNEGVDIFWDQNLNGEIDGEYYLDYDLNQEWNNGHSGDSARVAMAPTKRVSSQAKLTWKIIPNLSLRYSLFHTETRSKGYSHNYRYNPEGDRWRYGSNQLHILELTHSVSKDMQYSLNFSMAQDGSEEYVRSSLEDYLPNVLTKRPSTYEFYSGGMNAGRYFREDRTATLSADLTWQANRIHQFKSGFELRQNEMKYREAQVLITQQYDWNTTVLPYLESLTNNKYWEDPRRPKEYAFYIQDKIELQDMVVNAGVRYDYFDPDFVVPADINSNNLMLPADAPVDSLRYKNRIETEQASPKTKLSPRLGIAFPITDRGIIHFSYGHFFQIPTYSNLYDNPEFEVEGGPVSRGGEGKILGNANLEPQKTVIYEIGLQQQLSETIGMEVIGFYKDIQDLLSSQIYQLENPANQYSRYVNQDYGNVKGVTFSLDKRATQYLSGSVDYTYQVAEGNASDPLAQYYDNLSTPPVESEKKTIPLDWDQTHSLNFMLAYDIPGSWGGSILGQYGSGLPYTPQYQGYRLNQENSARKPATYKLDLYLYKIFPIGNLDFRLYTRVYNLLDRLNERYVYDDTGRATYSLIPTYVPDDGRQYGRHHLSNFLNRPHYYRSPRQIRFGLQVSF